MRIENVNKRDNLSEDSKLSKSYKKLQDLIDALNKKTIPDNIVVQINDDVLLASGISGTEKELEKSLKKVYSKIIKLIEEELKLVPKNSYRNKFTGLGIVFGVLFGTVFFKDNLGIGIPMGLVFGAALGSFKDKEAAKNGKQLDFESN